MRIRRYGYPVFLTPYRRQMTEEVFWHHPGIRYSAYGGYPEARRVRVKAWPAGGETMPSYLRWFCYPSPVIFPPDDKFEYELLQSLYAAGAEEDMIGDFLRDEEEQGGRGICYRRDLINANLPV